MRLGNRLKNLGFWCRTSSGIHALDVRLLSVCNAARFFIWTVSYAGDYYSASSKSAKIYKDLVSGESFNREKFEEHFRGVLDPLHLLGLFLFHRKFANWLRVARCLC